MSHQESRRAALLSAAIVALGCGPSATAAPAAGQATAEAQTPSYEQVDSFPALRGLYSWHALDSQRVIVWATPYSPYLVELVRPVPANELKFAHVIGVTSYGSQVSARFDSLRVDGLRYQIHQIFKLTKEEAEALSRPT